jgi:hypothetical protein
MNEQLDPAQVKVNETRILPKWLVICSVLVFLLGGMALRMLDLKDPPLDFHPSRQLFSYTIARGLYYKMAPDSDPELREKAIRAGEETDRYEPRIQEGLLAVIYVLTGGERFWIARIMTSAIWIIAGWFLFRLAARISSPAGAFFSLGYFLFLPFAIQASRSFQPDILMVLGIVLTAFLLYQWPASDDWGWTILTGLAGGLTILVKAQGFFAVASMAVITVIAARGFVPALKSPKIWVMALLMATIPGVYYLGPWIPGNVSYFQNFTVSMSRLLADPGFFVRWANFIHDFMDMGAIVLALLGTFFMPQRGKLVALGLWIGYGILGLSFPWQIHTHDYYSLALVPTVALGLAPVGDLLVRKIKTQNWAMKAAFLIVCLAVLAYPAWTARSALFGKDYRNEPGAWINMGKELPDDGKIIALTHDYGWRLQYWGYKPVALWPYTSDFDLHVARGGNLGKELDSFFKQTTSGYDYFLVTAYGELNAQPQLKEILEAHPIAQRGDGYILYDLRAK